MKNGITHNNLGQSIYTYDSQTLTTVDEAYICPSFGCNLNCPHCTLKNIKNEGNIDAIVDTIKYLKKISPSVSFTLFGGEPSLLKDETLLRIRDAIGDSSYSVSTNLINLPNNFLEILKDADLPDTSWNPKRFHTKELYEKWINNMKVLKENNITFELMITLTKDLIEMTPQEFIDKVIEWGVKYVKLEFMIGDDTLNPTDVDNWLVELYHLWESNELLKDYDNVLFTRLKDVANKKVQWEGNCGYTVSILPSGNLKERCPYYEYSIAKNQCDGCEYYEYCLGGCPIQDKCVFPKQLFELIRKKNNV